MGGQSVKLECAQGAASGAGGRGLGAASWWRVLDTKPHLRPRRFLFAFAFCQPCDSSATCGSILTLGCVCVCLPLKCAMCVCIYRICIFVNSDNKMFDTIYALIIILIKTNKFLFWLPRKVEQNK